MSIRKKEEKFQTPHGVQELDIGAEVMPKPPMAEVLTQSRDIFLSMIPVAFMNVERLIATVTHRKILLYF
jgi:hypothetical protein